MPVSSKFYAAALVAMQVASMVRADLYMHHPPGSNDRNRERNENRNNGNRIFDSQNNDKGGYPWAGDRELQGTWDGQIWYADSELRIEWTLQHAAGPKQDVDAQVLFQYSCDSPAAKAKDVFTAVDALGDEYSHIGGPFLRDGYPTGPLEEADNDNAGQYKRASFRSQGQNADGTNTIRCPSSIGCQGPNFGDNLDNDATLYNQFYSASSGGVQGTSGTWYPVEFAYHETFYYYRDMCLFRQRNKGLFTADQEMGGRERAIYTRQENNGDRHGFECTEERDYYPWWNPSPWVDIAVFVSNEAHCDYYKAHSQNVESRWYCKANDPTAEIVMPVTATGTGSCETADGKWTEWPSHGVPAPECKLHPISRDNHLGNVAFLEESKGKDGKYSYSVKDNQYKTSSSYMPETAYYMWKIPTILAGKNCVLRMRYNMSSSDYAQSNWQSLSFKENANKRMDAFWDLGEVCPANTDEQAMAGMKITGLKTVCQNNISVTDSGDNIYPAFNRPYVHISPRYGGPVLSIAYNTDQVARTFQDRSYVFKVIENKSGRTVVNLSMRGRRGNIVQCYPSVELDYVPHDVQLESNQILYIQFCGSDFNPNNNPNNGEGWQYSTRANMVNLQDSQKNFPTNMNFSSIFDDKTIAEKLAFLGIDETATCYNFQSDNSNDANNNITNCGKLNPTKACQRWEVIGIPMKQGQSKTWQYVNTRQNNFSNRAMKGSVTVSGVKTIWTTGAIVGVTVGAIVVVAGAAAAGAFFYAKKNPNSKIANVFSRKGRGVATTTL